jgi:hypothetical protein
MKEPKELKLGMLVTIQNNSLFSRTEKVETGNVIDNPE